MKKTMIVMAVVVAVVFIAGSVFAWGGCETHGKGSKECSNKEEMNKELGLTTEQSKQLETGRQSHRAEVKILHDAMKVKKEELKAAIVKPGATRAQVELIANELKALQARMTDKRIDGIFAVKAILTPEQFAKLETMKEKNVNKRQGKHKDKEMNKGR